MSQTQTDFDNLTTNWLAGSIRFTIFPNPSFEVGDDVKLWQLVVGDLPEKIDIEPKNNSRKLQSNFREGNLVFASSPTRIEWSYTVSFEDFIIESQLPHLGSYAEVREIFTQLVFKWLDLVPNLQAIRLAYGLVLVQPVDSTIEAMKKLKNYISLNIDEGVRDFIYQINIRKPSSAIEDLEINRLRKWQVGSLIKSVEHGTRSYSLPNQHFLRLELDINTIVEYESEFNQSQAKSLLPEFIGFANEIISQGDV